MLEIGSSLGRAREARGLDLADVEAATRIRARYLAALEEERFEQLPEGYAATLLRSYGTYLELDAQQLVEEYEARFPPKEPIRLRRPSRRRRRWSPSWVAVPLLAGGAVALAFLVAGQGGARKPTPAPSKLAPAPPRPAVAAPGRNLVHTPPVKPRPRVVLRASHGDCWIRVRLGSEGGRLLYENLLRPGQSVSFRRLPLWIRVGAPGNLVLTLGGRRLAPLTGYRPLNVVVGVHGLRPV